MLQYTSWWLLVLFVCYVLSNKRNPKLNNYALCTQALVYIEVTSEIDKEEGMDDRDVHSEARGPGASGNSQACLWQWR